MEDAKKRIDDSLEQLAISLECGRNEKLKEYLAVIGRFHHYSLGNAMLIAMQRPDATHVAGFQAWKRLGRWVKAGEHGIAIVAPIVRKRRQVEDAVEDERRSVVCFKGCRVFDVSQTNGKPLVEFATVGGDPSGCLEHLKSFVASRGIELTYAALSGALGLSAGGSIILRSGLTPAEEYSTLVHECAHELLHKDRGTTVTRNVRELEAEAVAFVVCQSIALDTNTAASDYIQLYQGDRKLLMASLERIRTTSAEIIAAIKQPRAGDDRGAKPLVHNSARESLAA